MLGLACSRPGGEKLSTLCSGNSGSGIPELQPARLGNTQKLRSFFPLSPARARRSPRRGSGCSKVVHFSDRALVALIPAGSRESVLPSGALYAPQASVLFHEYAQMSSRRRNVPKFWESGSARRGDGQRSLKRLTSLIHMNPPGMDNDWDRTKMGLYGLGTERPVELFYKLTLVDVSKRSAVPICRFVDTGEMHKKIHNVYLRPNGRGIDYSGAVRDLDVMQIVDERLFNPAINQLKRGLEKHDHNIMKNAVAEAQRCKLEKLHPQNKELIAGVRSELATKQGA